MAYSTGAPPRKITDAGLFGGGVFSATGLSSADSGGGSVWLYRSTHSSSEVISLGFISRGSDIGIRLGDLVANFPQSSLNSSKITWHAVIQSSFNCTGTTGSTALGWMDHTLGSAT